MVLFTINMCFSYPLSVNVAYRSEELSVNVSYRSEDVVASSREKALQVQSAAMADHAKFQVIHWTR
jgi:hypothetical protein